MIVITYPIRGISRTVIKYYKYKAHKIRSPVKVTCITVVHNVITIKEVDEFCYQGITKNEGVGSDVL